MRIKVNHIDNWAKERDCQGKLPLLVKKLILASSKNIRKCNLPTETQIYLTGFDGIVESDDENLFVPKGNSVWEMGCSDDWRKKANGDYLERKKEPLGIFQKNTTYIQVSPKLIEKKDIDKWTKSRINQKVWKDVKLYGALELETWINETPSVERWFAEILGFPNKGVQTLERWWSKWCQLDENLEITPELVLTDKENEIGTLSNLLRNNSKITIHSNNIEESIAFLYAAISKLPEKDLYLSKALVINDEESMEFYSQMDNLILIPSYDNYQYYEDGKNTLIIHTYLKNQGKISLTDPIKLHFIENLEKMGIQYSDAKRYAKDSGRNLTVLKRLFNPQIQPVWPTNDNIQILIPLFFSQSFDDNNRYDTKIIENLSGMDYEEFIQRLIVLANECDSPIFKNNNKNYLKSPKDLLFIIGKYITPNYLNKVENIIDNVFKKSDVKFKHGKYSKCSNNLKKGLLKSLILISVYGEDANMNNIFPEKWVDSMIYHLFEDETEEFWNNNYGYLKLMAEASPSTFLENTKNTMKENGTCLLNHLHYLLPALKILALDPFSFKEIIDIHIELIQMEFNDEIIKFLKEMYVPWYRNTNASLKARLNILNGILDKTPEVGWKILEYLLSYDSNVLFINNEPYWRIFYEHESIITNYDLLEFYHSVRMKLLENIGWDMDKWSFALTHYRRCFDEEYNDRLIEKLFEYVETQPENIELWNLLRENICGMRSIPEHADFAKVTHLEKAYYSLTPKELIQRYSYLFDDNWPYVLDCTLEQRNDEIIHKQKDAVNYIYRMRGFEGIKELINSVEYPSIIGFYMHNKGIDEEVFGIINENEKMNQFASRYIFKKSFENKKWSNEIINKLPEAKYGNDKTILILTSLNPNCTIWRKLKLFNEEVQDEYWMKMKYWNYCKNAEECKYYLNKVLKYSKSSEIVEFIYRNKNQLDLEVIGDILLEISIDDKHLESNRYIGKELLKTFNENNYDEEKLIKLELKFSSSFKFEKPPYPLKIHEKMSRNPKFASKIIKSRKSDNIKLRRQARNILETWSIIPGSKSNGDIDYDLLDKWFNDCLKTLNYDEIEYFYYTVGEILSKSDEKDGIWPRKEVCKFIDEKNNEKINHSFRQSTIRKYSTYCKSLYDGGNRETTIAKRYEKYALKILEEYPITAKILYEISKKFENDSKHEKFESDIIDYEYD